MIKRICSVFALGLLLACQSNKAGQSTTPNTMDSTYARKEWIGHTNVYEVNLRQYTQEGTINAFLKELPRLRAMGVETLWFMPLTPIAQKNKKGSLGSYYAAADYTTVSAEFGTMDDFRNLVKEAHRQGFKVIIDWVANHTGWDHEWTKSHPDWYLKDSTTGDFLKASGMDDIIELDFRNTDMRRAMIDAMKLWVTEADIDGFRCDLAFWVELDFWQEAKAELDQVKPLFWLAEADPLDHAPYMQVFDAAYTWTWMHKAREFYHDKLPVSALDSVLDRYRQAPGMQAWFTTNHDENSWNGTEYEKYGEMAQALAVFSCTWPGLPLLYSGQELPNRKRLEFFEKDPIAWNGRYELADFYQKLLTLHKEHPALNALPGATETSRLQTSDNSRVFAFSRTAGDRKVVVALNLSPEAVTVDLDQLGSGMKDVFSGQQQESGARLSLQPWAYRVWAN